MKNKYFKYIKIFLIAFIFSILNIGNVFASSKIELTDIEIDSKSSTTDASISDFSSDEVETNIVYHKYDDYVVFKLKIHNNDSKDYIIESITNDNTNPYIEYEYDDYKNYVLKGNSDLEILIKSRYVNELTDIEKRDQDSSVKFMINFMDEDGDLINIDIDINPATGDSIYLYLEVLGICIILLLLISLVLAKSDKARMKKLFMMILVYILMTPVCMKALEIGVSITFKNDVELQDKVKVTYNADGEISESIIDYNSKAEEKLVPEKDGYRFDGWYLGNIPFDFDSNVVEDITLIAKYTKVIYNITYHTDGGNVANPSFYKINELPLILNNPEKEGYNFTGWTDIDGNNSMLVVITNEARDLEFTANYELKNYQLTYNDVTDEEKETMNNPETYTIQDTIDLNNPENRNDEDGDLTLKFVGWKDETGSVSKNVRITNSKDDKAFTATWVHVKPDTFTIVYILNDGVITSGTNPNEYTKITDTFTLKNPEREGWKFTGWTGTGLTTPTKTVTIEQGSKGNREYTANFEEFSYDITYNLDGGEADNPTTYKVTDTITLNNPTKRGYRFTGWTGTDLNGLTQNVTIPLNSTGEREYTAHFEIEEYEIHYVLNGGVVDGNNQTTYTVNETFTLINPTLEGYIFDGWTSEDITEPQNIVEITNEVGEKTFTANFSPNSYTIKFKKNDDLATGTMADLPMSYDTAKKLTKNAFTKEGYMFVKWTRDINGEEEAFDDEEEVLNLATTGTVTLYAQWHKVTTAIFASGSSVNAKMKQLSGQSGANKSTENSIILKVKYSDDIPNEIIDDTNYVVSDLKKSEKKIYMWYDSDTKTIYYGSEADVIKTGTDASYMFAYLRTVTEIDTNFITDDATTMELMFYGCYNLSTLDISHFKTSNVTKMISMFGELHSMTSYDIKGWDVSKVTNFQFMFNGNYALVELDLTGWNTESATIMKNMFSSMYALKTLKIQTFNTSNVTDMRNMFDNERAIESLDLSNFNTANVTSMEKMFYNMYQLTSLNILSFNTEKVTNMKQMFIGTRSIETLDLSSFNTAKVTGFDNMFSDMTALKTIYVSNKFVTTKQTSNPIVFRACTNLEGGAGTKFATVNNNTLTYARVDNPPTYAGYFTLK